MLNKDKKERFYNYALKFLSFRPRSKKELFEYLKKKNCPAPIAKKIIFKLGEFDLVNDISFVDWWLEQRLISKPKGARALRQELLQKGIDKEIIEQKLSKIDKQQLEKAARKVLQKKIKYWKELPQLKLKKKIFNLLAYRGFDFTTINNLIDESIKKS